MKKKLENLAKRKKNDFFNIFCSELLLSGVETLKCEHRYEYKSKMNAMNE